MSVQTRLFAPLICVLLASTAFAETADPQRCLTISDQSKRLACYDAALGRSTAAPVPAQASESAADPAPPVPTPAIVEQPDPAPVIAEQPVAQPAPEKPAVPQAPAEPVQSEAEFGLREEPDWDAVKDDRITASVVDVDKTPLGSTVVELDNNHVWQQVDSKRLTLRKGDEVTIRGGMGGSFYLAKTSGSRSLKVKRIK